MTRSAGAVPRLTSRGPFRRTTVLLVLGVQAVVLVRLGPDLLTWAVTRMAARPHPQSPVDAMERLTAMDEGRNTSGWGGSVSTDRRPGRRRQP